MKYFIVFSLLLSGLALASQRVEKPYNWDENHTTEDYDEILRESSTETWEEEIPVNNNMKKEMPKKSYKYWKNETLETTTIEKN